MSSGKLNEIHYEKINEINAIDFFDISELVIPFSQLFNKDKSIDIYSGIEKIPFKERNPEYKLILRQEFVKF